MSSLRDLSIHFLFLLRTKKQSAAPGPGCHQKPFPHPSSPQRPHTLPSRMPLWAPSSLLSVELLCQPLVEHLFLPQSFLRNLPCLLLTPLGYRPAGSYSISPSREPRKHWSCRTLHSAAPTFLRVSLLHGIPGSRVNYERSCHVVRGGGLASPAAGPPRPHCSGTS